MDNANHGCAHCPTALKPGLSKQVLKGHNPARFILSPLKHVQPGRRENPARLWPLGMFDLNVCTDPTSKELVLAPNKFLLCSSVDGGNGSDPIFLETYVYIFMVYINVNSTGPNQKR